MDSTEKYNRLDIQLCLTS
ncbi:unnamed protein product [Victoria cruziana]